MKVEIYKAKDLLGTAEFKKGKITFDIEDKDHLKELKKIYKAPYKTLKYEEGDIISYTPVELEPGTKEHFDAVSSEIWKWGYGGVWAEGPGEADE
ncbi:MAG: hypothetical protein ACE5E0_04650 [Terriglobia bacterium]